MAQNTANVIELPKQRKKSKRKSGLNQKKTGSIRVKDDKVFLDFIYLNERIRVFTGLSWNVENRRIARKKLDKIIAKIVDGSFRFAEVLPYHPKVAYFTGKENQLFGYSIKPSEVKCFDYFKNWLELLESSGRLEEVTLQEYRRYINLYILKFFSSMTFGDLNKVVFEKFIGWIREQKLKGSSVCNKTINKLFIPIRMVCNDAAIEYDWISYNPFFGFKRLDENDPYEKISPFSLKEQIKLISELPDHWKPYFKTAFRTGMRQGEQIALKISDIDWEKRILHIKRAMTRAKEGGYKEGKTKNKYSIRSFKLNDVMYTALLEQKVIYDKFQGEYFFCSPEGAQVHISNLSRRVWLKLFEKKGIKGVIRYREMKQTRHTFATIGLASNENPLWISNVLGHRNGEMVIKVYSKFVENVLNTQDGNSMSELISKSEVSKIKTKDA